jgi:hypothetical protein
MIDPIYSSLGIENLKDILQDPEWEDYKSHVLGTLSQLSDNYMYGLKYDNGFGMMGTYEPKEDRITPNQYSLNEATNLLFRPIFNEWWYWSGYGEDYTGKKFMGKTIPVYPIGLVLMISNSDLIALNIDKTEQLDALNSLDPRIVSDCRFKRTCDNQVSLQLFYKKPSNVDISKVHNITINDTKILVMGTDAYRPRFTLNKDVVFLHRNYTRRYRFEGHMDDITECPESLISIIYLQT